MGPCQGKGGSVQVLLRSLLDTFDVLPRSLSFKHTLQVCLAWSATSMRLDDKETIAGLLALVTEQTVGKSFPGTKAYAAVTHTWKDIRITIFITSEQEVSMNTRITSPSNYPTDFSNGAPHFQPQQLGSGHIPLDDLDIRDTPSSLSPSPSTGMKGFAAEPGANDANNFMGMLRQLLEKYFNNGAQPTNAPGSDSADIDGSKPVSSAPQSSAPQSSAPTSSAPTSSAPTSSTPTSSTPTTNSRSVEEAAANTNPQFKPVIRGDEAQKDAQITDQASFGRAADEVAKEYGLDPNMFRAQLQKESGAFSQGYQKAMKHEGDLDRAGDNNTSIGLGQTSRKFLDGREWTNPKGGTVTTEQFTNSPTVQLRQAAANLAGWVKDHGNGNLDAGLRGYVSGHTTADSKNQDYIDSINKLMQDKEMMNLGR
jgi:hypothetical protein